MLNLLIVDTKGHDDTDGRYSIEGRTTTIDVLHEIVKLWGATIRLPKDLSLDTIVTVYLSLLTSLFNRYPLHIPPEAFCFVEEFLRLSQQMIFWKYVIHKEISFCSGKLDL